MNILMHRPSQQKNRQALAAFVRADGTGDSAG